MQFRTLQHGKLQMASSDATTSLYGWEAQTCPLLLVASSLSFNRKLVAARRSTGLRCCRLSGRCVGLQVSLERLVVATSWMPWFRFLLTARRARLASDLLVQTHQRWRAAVLLVAMFPS